MHNDSSIIWCAHCLISVWAREIVGGRLTDMLFMLQRILAFVYDSIKLTKTLP